MRIAKTSDGTRKFSRDEWLTKIQVQTFFSRLAAAQRRQVTPAEVTEDEGGVLLEDELAQLEQKNKDEDVQEILSQIGVEHPITYHGYNICNLVKTGALSRFTLKELRATKYSEWSIILRPYSSPRSRALHLAVTFTFRISLRICTERL